MASHSRRPSIATLLAVAAVLIAASGVAAWVIGRDADNSLPTYYGQEIPPCRITAAGIKRPSSPPPAAGAWRKEPDSPLNREEATGTRIGDKIYIVGGHKLISGIKEPWNQWSTGRSVVFDTRTRKYRDLPDIPQPLDHASAATHRGKLYVVGGWSQERNTNAFWRFDPVTAKWTKMPPMRHLRGALGAQVVGNKLYAIGGTTPTLPDPNVEALKTTEVFDFDRRTWSDAADMPTSRHHLSSATLDGKVYVAGGRQAGNDHLSAFERYDPKRNRWEQLEPIPQGVSDAMAFATDDEVILVGGGDGGHFVTPAVWAFNPATAKWRRLPDLRQARRSAVGGYVDGRLYVFEGSPCPGYGGTNSAESLAVS